MDQKSKREEMIHKHKDQASIYIYYIFLFLKLYVCGTRVCVPGVPGIGRDTVYSTVLYTSTLDN